MAGPGRVLTSIETEDGLRCVDLVVRADGSFGFQEYRRDFEDRRGWAVVGNFADWRYDTAEAALAAARASIPWLGQTMATNTESAR